MQRGGQYIQLAGSEASDLDKQSTLKIRRDNSLDGSTMPDVIKRGGGGDYSTTGRRYVPLGGGAEPEYATINKLSGAHVATLLGERGSKTLPRPGERPVLSTFGGTVPRVPDRDEALELDSVSSSRSGDGSSTRTQSSYGDSLLTSDKRSDSDSAPSTASARSKDSGIMYGSGGRASLQGPARSFSSNDSGTGSCPRLVDEAYGTMGSQGSAATIRSSSTASTGSGSSGSVITVIPADDHSNGSLHRRGGKPPS
jgi:hypothetical protein